MDKTQRLKKHTAKKLQHLIKQQQHLELDKEYSPGKLEFVNSQKCEANLVNFFGDVHTQVFSIKVSADQKNVVAGCANGEAKLYDLIEGKLISINNTSRMVDYPCTAAKWKPIHTDDFVTCNCDGSIKWYNIHKGHAYGHYQHQQKAYLCCDYQSLEEWCAFGSDINTIEIFDNETFKPIRQYQAGGPSELNSNHHTNRVFSVKCLPKDVNLFISGGWDSTVHIWDIRVNGGSVRKINGPVVSADSLDIKNNVLLAGNYLNNDMAQLYDFGSGQLIKTLDIGEAHNSKSYCFAASYAQRSEHNLIALGLTGSNTVKVLLDDELVCTMKLQAAPLCLDFYRYNKKDFLVVGGLQGTIYAIKLRIHK